MSKAAPQNLPAVVSRRGVLERQTRYLSQSIRLAEVESPGIVRATIFTLALTLAGFIAWSAVARVSEIARSPGEIIPAGQTRIVQHRDGGMISDILVKEGQHVKQGQPLLRMDDAELKQDLARAQARQTALTLQEERLRALIAGRDAAFAALGENAESLIADERAYLDSQRLSEQRDIAVIDDQIAQKRKALAAVRSQIAGMAGNEKLMSDLTSSRQKLNDQGVLSDVKLLETRQRHNELRASMAGLRGEAAATEVAISELEARKQSLSATRRDDAHQELTRVLAESAENAELIGKLQTRMERLLVAAPVAGTVQGMENQLRGHVIQPGQPVMEIVPQDAPLVVALKVTPRDVGHLAVGQPVQVKISSYDFARYGSVTGKLESLSPTTFQGEKGERYYEAMVKLDRDYVGVPANRIQPGMTVMADIITGDKTVLAYLMKPLQMAAASAFTER